MIETLFVAVIFLLSASVLSGENVAFLASESDTFVITKAMKTLDLAENIKIYLITPEDIENIEKARGFVAAADLILVDVMISELVSYLEKNIAVKEKTVFALRASRNVSA
jgi:hypothetical protein